MCRNRVLFVITDNQNTWDFQLHTFSYCFKISYCSRALFDRKWTKDITIEKRMKISTMIKVLKIYLT